jgi:RNA polymerase sigma factor (sigma-70 family)
MKGSLFFLHDDARLLDMMRRGNEEALVQLFRVNRKAIMSLVLRNNGSPDEAEDILQEAVVVLWERVHAGRYRHEAHLSTFIFATAKNIWLRRLARRKREAPLSHDDPSLPTTGDPSPLDALIEEEESSLVGEALRRLGDPCKTLLSLFYWEELSMEEIASRLGFANADTAKAKKYQCKNALKRIFQQMTSDHGTVDRHPSGI